MADSRFSKTPIPRVRWNVLDLINVVAKGSIPTYLFVDVDMSWAEKLRQEMAERGHKTTITAILLKAISIAQLKHPLSRTGVLPWGGTFTFKEIVAGFTVEKFINGEPAVYFGAIVDPVKKSLEQIASELRSYAESDVTQIPQLDIEHRFTWMPWLFRRFILWLGSTFPSVRLRYQGASFGLSSLGKFGIKMIIPPCVSTSTFGIGEVEDRPVIVNGQLEIRPMMTIVLNFDHRIIDGGPAARFLSDVIKLLEGGLAEHLVTDIGQSVSLANT